MLTAGDLNVFSPFENQRISLRTRAESDDPSELSEEGEPDDIPITTACLMESDN